MRFDCATIARAGTARIPEDRLISAPVGGVIWCGPSAVSAVTGATTDLAALLIAFYRWQADATSRVRSVRGTYPREVQFALSALGWDSELFVPQYETNATLTVAAFADLKTSTGRAYVVQTTSHFLVTQGGRIADRKSGGVVHKLEAKYRRARVVRAIEAYRVALVDFVRLESAVREHCAAIQAARGKPARRKFRTIV